MNKTLNINIYQGSPNLLKSDINIIIDVIRAFSVSYYAFKQGVEEILLVRNEHEAFELKKSNPSFMISGEQNGYKIQGFDFGNSPYEISKMNLKNKILIQKTTNGVKTTLNSLNAKKVFVTGYINSLSLIKHIKNLINNSNKKYFNINIIASHPTGDDDLSCAEYIKTLLLYDDVQLEELDKKTLFRIVNSQAAKKFWNKNDEDFSINDIVMAATIQNSDFVMEVFNQNNQIRIKKENICMD